MEREGDTDTNSKWHARYSHERIGTATFQQKKIKYLIVLFLFSAET